MSSPVHRRPRRGRLSRPWGSTVTELGIAPWSTSTKGQ